MSTGGKHTLQRPKAKAGSSLPSFVEGDVGGKGRRCATAPAHPTLVLTHWHSLAPHPFMATKSTVYMGLCIYLYHDALYTYTVMIYLIYVYI